MLGHRGLTLDPSALLFEIFCFWWSFDRTNLCADQHQVPVWKFAAVVQSPIATSATAPYNTVRLMAMGRNGRNMNAPEVVITAWEDAQKNTGLCDWNNSTLLLRTAIPSTRAGIAKATP